MTTELTTENAEEIPAELAAEWAREINNEFQNAIGTKQSRDAIDAARKEAEALALTHAAKCGMLMDVARQKLGRHFTAWMAANCPDISDETQRRFISGAKKVKALGINTEDGKQLLMFFAETVERETMQKHRDPDGSRWFYEVGRLVCNVSKQLSHRPIDTWTDNDKEAFAQRIKPIIDIAKTLEIV